MAAGYLAAVVLAAVFAVAGVAKLRRPGATAHAFGALGLRRPGVLARAVPVAELVVATALVVVPSVGAYAAIALLVAFSLVVVRTLRAHLEVPCGCLGAAHEGPVSSVELLRNALLLAAAVAATFASRPVAPTITATVTVAAATAGGLAVVSLAAMRRDSRASPR